MNESTDDKRIAVLEQQYKELVHRLNGLEALVAALQGQLSAIRNGSGIQ